MTTEDALPLTTASNDVGALYSTCIQIQLHCRQAIVNNASIDIVFVQVSIVARFAIVHDTRAKIAEYKERMKEEKRYKT